MNIICAGEDSLETRAAVGEIASTLSVYSLFGQNSLKLSTITRNITDIQQAKKRIISK